MKKKIVCLTRVSTKIQATKNSSPIDQQKQVQEYCDRIGAELIETIHVQVSGSKMQLMNQSMLNKALQRAEELGADLAVSRLDRASRSAIAIMQMKEATETTGINLHIASLNKSMKEISHLEAGMMGLVADAERRSIQARIARACKDRVGAFGKDVCPRAAQDKGLKKRMAMTQQWAESIELKKEIVSAVQMLKIPNQRNVVQVLNGRKILSRTVKPWTQSTLAGQLKVLGWDWDKLKIA